jgi:hypothetical protein
LALGLEPSLVGILSISPWCNPFTVGISLNLNCSICSCDSFSNTFSEARNSYLNLICKQIKALIKIDFQYRDMDSGGLIFILEEHVDHSWTHTPIDVPKVKELWRAKKCVGLARTCLAVHENTAVESILKRLHEPFHVKFETRFLIVV